MGQFSWLDCVDGRQVVDGALRDVYVLVPQEFADRYGSRIKETRYDGYGNFGEWDIYDLIASWNQDFIPEMIDRVKAGNWHCDVRESDIENLQAYYEGRNGDMDCELRWVGIMMACYDEDNCELPYPIKITHRDDVCYEDCTPSESDPNQGWE